MNFYIFKIRNIESPVGLFCFVDILDAIHQGKYTSKI
jgi:hypothetical protein